MARYRAHAGRQELGPWRPTREHALQDAIETGNASRDPFTARVYIQPLVHLEEDASELPMNVSEARWLEAVELMQRHGADLMRWIGDRLAGADARDAASWRAVEREVRAISEREQRRQAKASGEPSA